MNLGNLSHLHMDQLMREQKYVINPDYVPSKPMKLYVTSQLSLSS